MRFMSIVKGAEGLAPTPALMAAIGALAEELTRTGVLVTMGGLMPSARGARIRLSGGRITVLDGPFAESKEIVGGFAILDVASRAEAVELGRRFAQAHADALGPGHQMEVELREMEGSGGAADRP